ncbi:MAG: IscS subfamily cysteine desulfurase [Ketobacteraceae bacterium]|nr:IscS subfamily cysteine desulfurase [Ketobacteraceae bacterium]
MKRPVYLDYAATTPVDPRVADKMSQCLTLDGLFANPASRSHLYGWQAEEAVEAARQQVADLLNADTREIVWTSGATEANNLAIKGYVQANRDKGNHIITSAIEHKAVLDTCAWLASREGFEVTYLQPDASGLIQPAALRDALRDDTLLVSLMHVNNEIGTVNDIAELGQIARDAGAVFHTDAAQSAGKLPLDMQRLPVDLCSLSGHKIYGPKGVGALYVRRQPAVRLMAQMHGGGHERGMRSGTLATHQAVGMGEAFAIARGAMQQESEAISALRNRLWDGLRTLEGVHLNGDPERRVAGILNVSVDGVDGEALMMGLGDLAISSGSACNSASVEPSYVVSALGVGRQQALAALRFSLGRFTTAEEVDFAVATVHKVISGMRGS